MAAQTTTLGLIEAQVFNLAIALTISTKNYFLTHISKTILDDFF